LLTLLIFSSTAFSAIWRVNNKIEANADFISLKDAVDAASNGDIIYVEGTGTTYVEDDIDLYKSLTIYGTGYFLQENSDTQANHFSSDIDVNITFNAGSEGSICSGLSFVYGFIYVFTSDITIERCYIDNEIRLAATDQNCSNFLLKQCYLYQDLWTWSMSLNSSNIGLINNIIYGEISLTSDMANYVVKNNVFIYHTIMCRNTILQNNILEGGINSSSDWNNQIENNIIAIGGMIPETGTNTLTDIDLTEVFVDYPDGENTSSDSMFELKGSSVAQGYGVGGVDCGVFDGDFPYVLSGLPPLPRIFESNISGVGTSEGLQVSIKAKSQQ